MGRTSKNMVDDAREQAKLAEHAYLRQHGWTYTSATPSCHWLWEKRFAYHNRQRKTRVDQTILCDTPTAIAIQAGVDALGGEAR